MCKHVNFPWIIAMPQFDSINIYEFARYFIKPMMKNENTIFNNIYIFHNLFAKQFRFNRSDFKFARKFHLIYENLKTVKRMFAVNFLKKLTTEQL